MRLAYNTACATTESCTGHTSAKYETATGTWHMLALCVILSVFPLFIRETGADGAVEEYAIGE
jgi:hypothetical protein